MAPRTDGLLVSRAGSPGLGCAVLAGTDNVSDAVQPVQGRDGPVAIGAEPENETKHGNIKEIDRHGIDEKA